MPEGILIFDPPSHSPSLQPSILFEQYWRWKNLTQITKACIEKYTVLVIGLFTNAVGRFLDPNLP